MLDVLFGAVLKVHQAIYEATGGLIGHHMLGRPTLLLHTIGRKTGKARTAALVYAEDSGSYIVVGSKGGADVSPGWFFNAKANPEVDIQFGRRRSKAKAEPIMKGDPDYDRLWALTNKNNGNRYNSYQSKTSRPIPLLRLTPLPS
jgi:F420H(2)-dependent quinone reductase